MYSIRDYGGMIADRIRMDAYVEAMSRVIRPGSVVVDLGAGPGIMSLHACRLGAVRVYAVEPDNSIAVAIELARVNGVADRITFLQEPAEKLQLPELVDVIVSDLRGIVPMHGGHLRIIADVRERWLRPGGTLIPRRDTLNASLISHPAFHNQLARAWRDTDFNLTRALKWCVNAPGKVTLKPEALLVNPQTWCVLDYRAQASPNVAGTLVWRIDKPATAHGLAIWFDAELAEGVGFSNFPGPGAGIYGQLFLPWPNPVELNEGDDIRIALAATSSGGDYSWRWTTEIFEESGNPKHKFVQGSFLGSPIGPKTLASRTETYVPKLSAGGDAARVVLEAIREGLSLRSIAERLMSECHAEFNGSFQKALDFAADVGEKWGSV